MFEVHFLLLVLALELHLELSLLLLGRREHRYLVLHRRAIAMLIAVRLGAESMVYRLRERFRGHTLVLPK